MRCRTRALLILPLALLAATNAKAADLYGKVVENELGGPPMVGIEIGAAGANPTATGSLGLFRLALPRRQPGETVSLTVHKEGYEVVNDVQLEVTLLLKPEDRPLILLLCRPKLCEEMRRRFYRLKGREIADASFQRRTRELEESNQATDTERTRLQKERDTANAAAEKLAEELARTRPTEGSDMYQKALRLVLEKRPNEALATLDEAKLRSSLVAARAHKETGRNIEQVVQCYLLRGKIFTLQFKFAKAEEAYRAAVEIAPENFEANFALANFAGNQKHYAQATTAFQRCLELARKKGNAADIAGILNNLGLLLTDQNRLDEARKAYDEALAIRRQLAKENPGAVRDVAETLNNLGRLLKDQNRLDEARKVYSEALASFRQLAEKNPGGYLREIAGTLNNLGLLLYKQNRLDEARKAYDEALAIYRQLAEETPDALPGVAWILNNLGLLLSDQNRLDEAGKAYDEALVIRRRLAAKNPNVFLPEVAATLNNLGLLLGDQNHPDEASKDYDEALAIYRQLSVKNPGVYLPYVAKTLNNLGLLLKGQNRLDKAKNAYDEALDIRRRLAEKNPDVYLPDIAKTLNNLGNLLSDQNRLDEAKKAYDEALAIRRQLAKKNPDAYPQYVAATLNDLGLLLKTQNRLDEARKAYDEALAIRRQLAKKNPDVYLRYVAITLNNLGNLLSEQSRLARASRAYDEALAIRRQLAKKNPDVYLPDVAETLKNLGLLLKRQNRLDKAQQAFAEAIGIIEPFAAKNPEKFKGLADEIKQSLQSPTPADSTPVKPHPSLGRKPNHRGARKTRQDDPPVPRDSEALHREIGAISLAVSAASRDDADRARGFPPASSPDTPGSPPARAPASSRQRVPRKAVVPPEASGTPGAHSFSWQSSGTLRAQPQSITQRPTDRFPLRAGSVSIEAKEGRPCHATAKSCCCPRSSSSRSRRPY